MKEYKTTIPSIVMGLSILALFLFTNFILDMGHVAQINELQEEEYNYCVEWEGWIYREDLFLNCYNLETQTQRCRIDIGLDNRLEITNILPENTKVQTNYYECSRLIKSKEVE